MEEFEAILDKDESIIKTFRPNKKKMFWSYIITNFFSWGIWFIFIFAFMFGGGVFGTTIGTGEDAYTEMNWAACGISALVVLVIFVLIVLLFFALAYSKTYYAYTNKKIIIRHGIIGVDYKCLDKNSIGAVNVNVSLIDKMVGKNTGTISFGSMSSPIMQQNAGYCFRHIENPYEIYKEIKADIEESKTKE